MYLKHYITNQKDTCESAVETDLETLLELLLLFVDYAETEVDLIGFLKVWLHTHDLRKCFFGMLK